ncbi:hypothetical protein CEQ90_16065 [Lewinellaceae bacterium SD302]|nr:hypothetical protein CEQ90_16065 [Lewinellaceae bacterium SD302]
MATQIDISVIIPTLNEADNLPQRILELSTALNGESYEIIVSDGGSNDATPKLAAQLADRYVSGPSGRACQLNVGAKQAKGRWLYFLHADTQPPVKLAYWFKWMDKNDCKAACFQMRFDHRSPTLNLLGYCTRFDIDAFRYGDQSLLVRHDAFRSVAGYDQSFHLMEGNDIVKRLKKKHGFTVLPDYVVTSARKYRRYGALYLQGIYIFIYCLRQLGLSQNRLLKFYRWSLNLPTTSEAGFLPST